MNKPNLDPKRLDGESYEEYKARQKAITLWLNNRNDENFIHVSKYVRYDEKGLPTSQNHYDPVTYVKS